MTLSSSSSLRQRLVELAPSDDSEAAQPPLVGHTIVWGPISARQAVLMGAWAPAESVLLRPHAPPAEAARVLQLFPDEIFPRKEDTPRSLADRLGDSAFLDDVHVPVGGMGGAEWCRLNATMYPQPRLVNWSAKVPVEEGELVDDATVRLHAYPHYGRPSLSDLRCREWPPAVAELASYVHKLAYPHLGPVSKVMVPNYCEVKIYYSQFGAKIGRHRDNFVGKQLHEYCSGGTDPFKEEYCQKGGSDVLIWSMGAAPMVLKLFFPSSLDDGDEASVVDLKDGISNHDRYITAPRFHCPLRGGHLLVFKCLDDFFYAHEAALAAGASDEPTWRMALVFRVLTHKAKFEVGHGHRRVMTEDEKRKEEAKLLQKAKKRRTKW